MKKLNNPWFLACLVILILNDFVLKAEFGNWFTGKLSDFVGLFVFPFFFSVLFPKRIKLIHWLTFFGFIFWKSSWSQPMIDGINTLGFSFSRVIDYSDLIALPMILVSYLTLQQKNIFTLKFSPVLTICVACFAFFSTSQPIHHQFVEVNKTYTFDYGVHKLADRFNQKAIERLGKNTECTDSLNQICYKPEEQCYYQYFRETKYDSITKTRKTIGLKENKMGCLFQDSDIVINDSIRVPFQFGEMYIIGDSITSSLYVKGLSTSYTGKSKSNRKLIKELIENFENGLLIELQKPIE